MDNRIDQKEVKSLWDEKNLRILKILVPLEIQIIKDIGVMNNDSESDIKKEIEDNDTIEN